MHSPSYRLILASRSPRRKEILSWLKLPFDIESVGIEESSHQKEPDLYVQELALQKAQAVWEQIRQTDIELNKENKRPIILGADTVVHYDGDILEKPRDREHAKKILKRLSGKKHQVYTGVALVAQDTCNVFSDVTHVEFEKIDEDLLELYISSADPLDKAGAYGVQGQAQLFIKALQGSYSNVVGLPIHLVARELKSIIEKKGYQNQKSWREYFE